MFSSSPSISSDRDPVSKLSLIAEEQEADNEVQSDPLSFICKNPNEVYSRFGGTTKFIGETKGSCLELFDRDCLVKSISFCGDNSFIAINHPVNDKITLTLRGTHVCDDLFATYIGYFNPDKCQDDDCWTEFTGISPYIEGTDFVTNGTRECFVTSKLSPSQSIIISFENNKVTYSTPHSGRSRTVDCVDGWVFGIQMFCQGESWSIE
ncbi:hypothetical protein RCL1_000796 [Eukaryota sp. TZLM3-RCL]